MSRRWILVLCVGCITPAGQKVSVLIEDHAIDCVPSNDDGPATARFELDQEDDFYQVQLEELNTGVVRTLESTRTGRTVTFSCPGGFTELVLRHATILQARQGSGATSSGDGGDGGDGGDPEAPAP